ncbi:hypothetical protein D6745_05375 [Candidatus Woesearchaeota archaeon]|nr:MAG: hypothetical protein D6745_05375 [Candidatus Woesearchaeota archaeon]
MVQDLSNVKMCPQCGSSNTLYNDKNNELICHDCRNIFSELPDDNKNK